MAEKILCPDHIVLIFNLFEYHFYVTRFFECKKFLLTIHCVYLMQNPNYDDIYILKPFFS